MHAQLSLRRHVASLSADTLSLRAALDGTLAGDPRYTAALAEVRSGITALHRLADDLERDAATVRHAASPAHGDLVDGERATEQ